MCGIAGVLSSGPPIQNGVITPALKLLAHRGPDNSGQWHDPNGRIVLGHTRLRVMDLQSGDQPIANEAGDIHIVVNGEFYDFEEIRRELQSKGHEFATASDSEILLHLYEELGTQCLGKLRGEFAFALWDARNRILFAARDRFGIKPLYYSLDGDALRLASEAKALFALGCEAGLDNESLYQALSTQYPLENRSLYRGVYHVPPGHFLLATPSSLELRR